MDCFDFCEIYLDLDRPETRGAELRDEALAHAESCPACAARLIESESLDFSLRQVAQSAGQSAAPARIEAGLVEQFRCVHPAVASRKVRPATVWLAVAAMVLLAVGITIYRQRANVPAIVNAPSYAANRTPSPVNEQDVPSPSSSLSSSSSSVSPAMPSSNDVADVDSGNNEYASAFVPLPYSDGLSDSDSSTVVRVDLPRSSLASMGIPVSGLTAGDRVVADLVVSEDGTPQAIRLVSEAN